MNEPDAINRLVSVIVTTRNEERNIGNCLQSIRLQTYKPVEIIVVDNNSADKTQEIARSFTDAVVNKGPERSAQRNHGICELATGEYAMFIDADMILSPTLIDTCIAEIQTEGVVALHIEELILGRRLLAKIRRFERSFYSGTVIDGARFFRRSLFSELGGFDEELPPGPEDWDLDKRLKKHGKIALVASQGEKYEWELGDLVEGHGITFNDEYIGIYHNEDEQKLSRYLSKKRYYSPSMSSYKNKWGKSDLDLQKQLGFRYRFITVFTENSKYKKVLRAPVLTSLLILLRAIVGVSYLVTSSAANKESKPNTA